MATIPTLEQIRSRERFSQTSREEIDREAADDESKSNSQSSLWSTIRGYILNINYRYTVSDNHIILFEWDMHDLWYLFVQTAKITNADDPAQDRLVDQLLYAREMGTIRRRTTGTDEEAITSDGLRIWTDLPYLAEDMREVWEKSMDMSPNHRHNFAAFTARLPALGVCDTGLSLCALWLLREALETPRQLTRPENGDKVSVADMLPACVAWFKYCSHKLLTLAVNNHSFAEVDLHLSAPGELARNANIEQAGFSVSRWLFWRQRFKDISRCEDEQVAKEGRRGFDSMINSGREMGYKIAGESKYWAKVENALEEELKRSGKNNVSSEDIVIDLDWTE